MKRSIYSIIAGFFATGFMAVFFSGTALAASPTLTWTGTACNVSSGPNCAWSDSANWGGTAFSNGDNVIFPNSLLNSYTPLVDQADSVSSITFTGNNTNTVGSITLGAGLTVTGSIAQDSTNTTTTDTISSLTTAQTITLGGSVGVIVNSGLDFGDGTTPDSIALGGNTLTFTSIGDGIVGIDDIISGAGTVTYNLTNNVAAGAQLTQNSTYSGTTNVVAGSVVEDGVNGNNGFGTSAINVSNNAEISFDSQATTISNAIAVAGATNGSPVTSLDFDNSGNNNTTLTVPNITLSGSTRFGNDTVSPNFMIINLAGINANGNCIEYLGGDSGTESESLAGFTNGPAACLVAAQVGTDGATAAAAPGAPDTGSALMKSPYVLPLIGSLMIASGVYFISRRLKPSPATVPKKR